MARLILSLDGQTLAEYNMTKERYTVGRLPDNDIRIDNAAVSGHHSLIINILNDSFLEDLNSTNGTYVNGKLIKKHALQHGDVITVGHHQLRYVDDQAQQAPEDEFEKTMVIQPSAQVEKHVEKHVAQAARAEAAATSPGAEARDRERRAAEAPQAVRPDRNAGRRPGCGARASAREAAGVVRHVRGPRARAQQGAYDARPPRCAGRGDHAPRRGLLTSCTSRAARPKEFPLVNGMAIGPQARKLQDNDVIQLAGVKMGFFVT